ncbi:MAG: hypothetical protein AB1641_12955 [Thermodesulfobacteriota bacterium]
MPRTKELYRQFILDCFADSDHLTVEVIRQKAEKVFTREAIQEGFWPSVDEMISEGILKRVDHGRGLMRI